MSHETTGIEYLFQDPKIQLDERVRDLVSRLTLEEKIESMLQYQPAIDRLGVAAYKHGTEAAHGIAWLGEATSFPQPVGLACTWDTELMRQIGSVIADEARVYYRRDPKLNGLTLWAPTVDMERDPRWGRNEEAYGEDPYLTGELSKELVKGIQGNHPVYLKAVATLKHFLGNNNEVDRGIGSSSIDPRNLREYYLRAFEKPFTEGGAQSMMTSYNLINGTPATLYHGVNDIVRGEWGMDGFVVSDAGDVMGIVNDHQYYDSHTPGVAESIRAGIDSITDDAELSKQAIREALEQGSLQEEDLDRALFHTFRVRFRLGEFDPAADNPYASIGEEALMTEQARELSLRAAREQIVLLKNEQKLLPLNPAQCGKVAVIGSHGNEVFRDWYSGTLPYWVTPLEAIRAKLESGGAEERVVYSDAKDRVTLTASTDGAKLIVNSSGDMRLSQDGEPTVLTVTDWGYGSVTLHDEHLGTYVTSDEETLRVTADEAYGWYVKEVFGLTPVETGEHLWSTWNGKPVIAGTEGSLKVMESATPAPSATDSNHTTFRIETVSDGLAEAIAAAQAADTAIVFVGNHPLINGKEENDRPGLELAASQQRLIEEVYRVNPNTIVVLTGSYPFAIPWLQEHIPAIVYTSHAGQEHGTAIADVLFGDYAPAGRLNMTWVQNEDQLGDIRDYDIIRGGRTYQYFEGEPLYPFGHGLTYSPFEYSDLHTDAHKDNVKSMATLDAADTIQVWVDVTNRGEAAGEEVVQLYVRSEASRVKRPLKTLCGFQRIRLEPGETRTVSFMVRVKDWAIWDVTRDCYCVESGEYTLLAGASSADIRLEHPVYVRGEVIPPRQAGPRIRAENFDDCFDILLDESKEQREACVRPRSAQRSGWIAFHGVDMNTVSVAEFQCRVSGNSSDAAIELHLDGPDSQAVARINVGNTGGAQAWVTLSEKVQSTSGIRDVYLSLSGEVRLGHFTLGVRDPEGSGFQA
ncbi:glycoside hydrolase family 3 protein [Paenibacillus polymyxa]|uniref:glycoside hydrolase family 3 protein n=1 Tax=Paenibacillus polymyxa TaxID=1406 RepID=UPI0025B68100|nr:glycoside hydrolase family 3 protein [Paenibacillus polymyxa]MDN4081704.1 glycoside hydrolase family 3 C-terminal domain-containing protein [Paenibacillus polymyxa]MDN4089065.1 glycoside hydrolase family 3 C-terminal domain-containing protein [Paenibacillus polymyxa]MDN4109441.1 glycoside hydrolase family 3 C-terminal domain-containing protein [Paenibacillus polymyxa]